MLANIRIVLVNTSHPGNIGSAARAMKTMGLKELYLVEPKVFPHPKEMALASGAADLLEKAVVVETLDAALLECALVVGTSARSRTIPWPLLTPREFAEKARDEASLGKIAVVFGSEQAGLSNEDLQRCHFHIHIPSHADYSSLNLAAAVQVIAYELRVASLTAPVISTEWDYEWATAAQMESFYEHLQKVLVQIDFLDLAVPRQLMPRLRRLFNRARPDVMEMNILRGILAAVEKEMKENV